MNCPKCNIGQMRELSIYNDWDCTLTCTNCKVSIPVKELREETKQMQPHEQRVVDEKNELNDKLNKLSTFIMGNVFETLPEKQKQLLELQYDAMVVYYQVLKERISLF